jgi:hypothetical protein
VEKAMLNEPQKHLKILTNAKEKLQTISEIDSKWL